MGESRGRGGVILQTTYTICGEIRLRYGEDVQWASDHENVFIADTQTGTFH